MSEAQVIRPTALLARKGLAAPVGAASDAAQALSLSLSPAPVTDPVRNLEALAEVDAEAQARAAPPASLLPQDFLVGWPGARDPAQLLPDRPQVAVVPASVPKSVPTGEPKLNGAGETAAPPKAAAKPARSGTALPRRSGEPEVPHPDPVLRPALCIDAGMKPAARAEPRRFPALAAGLALALGIAGYGYQSGWFESPPPERPQATAAAAVAPVQTQPEQARPEAPDAVLTPTGAPSDAVPKALTETPAELPPAAPPVSEADPDAKADQPAGADELAGADQSSGAVQPSVDVVRIEPDGAAVIAGRAAPGVELIVLDNGAPIGTVVADAYGAWVFIPASPLPSGAHDFGLVIKEVRGGVSVPAAGQAPAKQDTAPDTALDSAPDAAADAAADAAPDAAAPGVPG